MTVGKTKHVRIWLLSSPFPSIYYLFVAAVLFAQRMALAVLDAWLAARTATHRRPYKKLVVNNSWSAVDADSLHHSHVSRLNYKDHGILCQVSIRLGPDDRFGADERRRRRNLKTSDWFHRTSRWILVNQRGPFRPPPTRAQPAWSKSSRQKRR